MIDTKPLCIMFNKVERLFRVYDGTRSLVLFVPEKYNAIFNRIRYLRGVKSGIIYVFSHCYARIKVDSYDSLALEETLTLHNAIILIKNIHILEKGSYQ